MRRHLLGFGLAVSAATLWGLGGVAAQALFHDHGVDPRWLVTARMVGGGLILLAAFRPALPRRHLAWLALWGVVGLAAAQYTWFAAIDLSNVATATFVQYLFVALTAAWQMVPGEVRPAPLRRAAVAASAAGVSMLILGQPGGVQSLRLQPLGVAFALASAVTAAFMFLGSARLVRAVGPWSATAWGLLVGSIPMLAWAPPWSVRFTGDLFSVALLTAFVVVVATALAFSLSFASLRRITPTEAAVSSTVEPAVAALAAFLVFGVRLLPLQYAGGAVVLAGVASLAMLRRDGSGPNGAPPRGRVR
jgi:drug/metabolite transporter (DMT)-like permease